MGTRDGSIIATIITSHMPTNDAAAAGQVCPGIRIHAMDIVQPLGIGIPIADMEPHQTMVTVALVAKTSAETPKNALSPAGSLAASRRNRPFCNSAALTMTGPQLVYSSWRRNHGPASLRPLGARSSHGYMLQMASTPRA